MYNQEAKCKVRAKKIIIALVSIIAVMVVTTIASGALDAKAKTTYADIEKFPESYKEALYALKEKHPSWTFEVMNTGLNWSEVIYNEMTPAYRSLVPTYFDSTFVGAYYGDGWACATQEAVEYYLDPRNWLTEDYIFQFEKLTYNGNTQGIATVQKVLQNTFMSGFIQNDAQFNYEQMGLTYAQAFRDIGESIGVSPVHLATRVKQEQGTQGTSDLISGVYPGYEGYYNYYNIQASGQTHEEIVANGLNEAKSEGWNNRYAALLGGSKKVAERYILRGQDTLYLQKFDVDGQYDGRYWHQYMQNLAAPSNEGRNIKKAYESSGMMDEAFVFKIPVYSNMPNGKVITLNVATLKWKIGDTGTPKAYIDGNKVDNSTVNWKSSNEKVAVVSSKGAIEAVGYGTCTITCYKAGYETAELTVIVQDKVTLNVASVNAYVGIKVPLKAYVNGEAADASTLTWKSSNEKVATVDSLGRVTPIATGSSMISCTVENGTVAQCKFTVNEPDVITLNVTKRNWTVGTAGRITAYVNGEKTDAGKLTWTSSDSTVATVTADGTIKAVGLGHAVITCSRTGATAAVCEVNVNDIVTLDKTDIEISGNGTITLIPYINGVQAAGSLMTWTSSDESVAVVDASGKVIPVSNGTAVISCTKEYANVAECKVTVSEVVPAVITLNVTKRNWTVGTSGRLTAFVDGVKADSTTLTWATSDAAVAVVDNNGGVTAVGPGTAVISCTKYNANVAECTVNVAAPQKDVITLNVTKRSWTVGMSGKLTAYVNGVKADGAAMTWSSSNEAVAVVDNSGGVTAVGAGTAVISCTKDNADAAECIVIVTGAQSEPEVITLNVSKRNWTVGDAARLSAYINGNKVDGSVVKWESSDSNVATVDSNGNVLAVGVGSCIVTCSKDGAASATCVFNITD